MLTPRDKKSYCYVVEIPCYDWVGDFWVRLYYLGTTTWSLGTTPSQGSLHTTTHAEE